MSLFLILKSKDIEFHSLKCLKLTLIQVFKDPSVKILSNLFDT